MKDLTTETQRHRGIFRCKKKCRFILKNLCVSVSLWLIFLSGACSIPNLESPECAEARTAVKEFYSFHFGNDMKPSPENLKLREKFLSKNLFKSLSSLNQTQYDYFTRTEDYPKAFRVAACGVVPATGSADFSVQLFWKSETREEQREIRVILIREDGKWVIDEVNPKTEH